MPNSFTPEQAEIRRETLKLLKGVPERDLLAYLVIEQREANKLSRLLLEVNASLSEQLTALREQLGKWGDKGLRVT